MWPFNKTKKKNNNCEGRLEFSYLKIQSNGHNSAKDQKPECAEGQFRIREDGGKISIEKYRKGTYSDMTNWYFIYYWEPLNKTGEDGGYNSNIFYYPTVEAAKKQLIDSNNFTINSDVKMHYV